jgi:hypothetical protein
MATPYHAKYYANEIMRQNASNDVERLSRSLFDSCVDLNPHQIEAALFALRSPISKGVILADEVGLGKTIEAGVLLCQLWAERKRRLIVICPASLRKQWSLELEEKFNLQSVVLEARSYKNLVNQGVNNPFDLKNAVVICSYNFASRMKERVRSVNWHMAVIDEAHKLRNVYRPSNKTGQSLKWALEDTKKVLLTATPLQNSLVELYGLATLIDDRIFGDVSSFRAQYTNSKGDIEDLKTRLIPFCKRTLRSQVLEYVPYTERKALTRPFNPTDSEQKLYEAISAFLLRGDTHAIPHRQRQLTSLILRKLLASSSFAVSGTLKTMKTRLQDILAGMPPDDEKFIDDLIYSDDIEDDFLEDEDEAEENQSTEPEFDRNKLIAEIQELETYIAMAEAIETDSKSHALLTALEAGFDNMASMGAHKKALIFTESRRTQEYLKRFLDANGYAGKITLFNGSNSDAESKAIYDGWVTENSMNGRATGSKIVDMRSALVENFRDTSEIMIATEAAAEGVNLQFCSLVVNYDLPWNPQRVEQRIGRCHRYGQRHDVVVINFLNQRNDADIRVHQLLEQKFNLFQGVFGASDEVLGTIESGVDFEKRILEIYETCRTPKEIETAFNKLQSELDETIKARMDDTRRMLFDNFDEDVHARLKMQLDSAKAQLDKIGRMFWETTKITLHDLASFNDDELSFDLKKSPYHGATTGIYHLISKDKENVAGRYLYRLSHPLGEHVIDTAIKQDLPMQTLHFDISSHPAKISVIEALRGKSGWLKLGKMTIDSLDRHEELVFTACTDDDSPLDHETCQKLFNCGATITGDASIPEDAGRKIGAEEKQRQSAALNRIMEQNNQFFREEHARIDKWADDMIFAAEKELKDIREQIKAIGRQVRLAESIEEQANLQQKELDLTKKRRKLRNQLDDIEDEIEQKARHMKDQLQTRLQQKVTTDDLFTIRWSVV